MAKDTEREKGRGKGSDFARVVSSASDFTLNTQQCHATLTDSLEPLQSHMLNFVKTIKNDIIKKKKIIFFIIIIDL